MRVDVEIKDEVLNAALQMMQGSSQEDVLEEALRTLVWTRQQQLRIHELRGKVEFWEDYDYKKMRGA